MSEGSSQEADTTNRSANTEYLATLCGTSLNIGENMLIPTVRDPESPEVLGLNISQGQRYASRELIA